MRPDQSVETGNFAVPFSGDFLKSWDSIENDQ
jgi:hypothetical protein